MVAARVSIAPDVLAAFPQTRVALVAGRDVTADGEAPQVARARVEAPGRLEAALGARPLAEHPHVAAWRRTYRALGIDPTRRRPSAEALARRLLRGEELVRISDVVDLYNAASVSTLVPAGGYDLDALEGDLVLRTSPGGEPFTPLGQVEPTEETASGEIVYADSRSVTTRTWNTRDCERTKITPRSTAVLLLCEAADPGLPSAALEDCAEAMARLLADACGATVWRGWLDARSSHVAVP